MHTRKSITLGISIGTNTTGLAVFKNSKLDDWQIKSFPGKWSGYKQRVILLAITRYVKEYEVDRVVIKVPLESHYSMPLKALINSLEKFCRSNGMERHICTIREIKEVLEIDSKIELMKVIVKMYPELKREHVRHLEAKNEYHLKLFEAVGAVMAMK